MNTYLQKLFDDDPEGLLTHKCEKIPRGNLSLPGPDFVDRVWSRSDRSPRVLANLARIHNSGRLGGTGYLNILPVDQGIEHTAGASFAPNPEYFDPREICALAVEAGCNAVASTLGVLASVSREFAHKIPFLVKLNHNELLTYPNTYDQVYFGNVEQAFDLGAAAVGATIYFGSQESDRQLEETRDVFAEAHELGMATVLWCYVRNEEFRGSRVNHETAADLTGQANHLGCTIGADIIKQKLPTHNGGFREIGFAKYSEAMYDGLATDHPIDLARYQVANCYMGRRGMLTSGGGSADNDFYDVTRAAVINKRAGGTGMITGRKAFQRSREEGVKLLHTVQDVYLEEQVTVA
jgi:class I fructose-bisphosphate aldolase